MSLEDGMEPLMSRYTERQEEKAQTTFLGGPWWKHTCEPQNWSFSSECYGGVHSRNQEGGGGCQATRQKTNI